jgi:peptidoglycan hydrolase CwlO-like protein
MAQRHRAELAALQSGAKSKHHHSNKYKERCKAHEREIKALRLVIDEQNEKLDKRMAASVATHEGKQNDS